MTRTVILFGAGLLCSIASCTSANNSSGVPANDSSGTLTLDWSINGSKDPNQCNQSVATDIDVVVTTRNGAHVGEFLQRCSDGMTTIALSPGAYVADAALLDGAGTPRTTYVNINPFVIDSNTDLSILVDFPASSFN